MQIRIHRGTKEIGGSCVELGNEDGERIVLDVSRPLFAGWDAVVATPDVSGLRGARRVAEFRISAADGGWPAVNVGLCITLEEMSREGLWWATIEIENGRTNAFVFGGCCVPVDDEGGVPNVECSGCGLHWRVDSQGAGEHE